MSLIDTFIEVRLKKKEDFLVIKETLTRIGVASKKDKKLYQSCHILHKQGKYYLVHFKQLFMLDGKPSDFTDDDKARTNTIADLLAQWELYEVVNNSLEPKVPVSNLKVISHKEKSDWEIVSKYQIGIKH